MKKRIFNNDSFPYFINESGEIYSELSNKYLKTSIDKDGYIIITLEHPVKKQYHIARIVLETFNNIPNSQYLQVKYRDKDKANINLSNLYWSHENSVVFEDEIWKKIVLDGEESFYSISNYGRCRNDTKNTILLGKFNKYTGYISFSLKYRTDKYISAHRAVMKAFCPCENMDDLQVNHIDGDKTNNKLSNLEWCNQAYNIQHAIEHDLISSFNNIDIYVYDLNGNFIVKSTPKIFSKEKNINYRNIVNCISGRVRSVDKKYQILREYKGEKISPWYKHTTNKIVYVYDKDTNELVNSFESQKDCSDFYKTIPSTISRCLKLNLLLQNKYIITREPLL